MAHFWQDESILSVKIYTLFNCNQKEFEDEKYIYRSFLHCYWHPVLENGTPHIGIRLLTQKNL